MSKADEILEDLYLFEMANIRKTTTGLPVNIFASPRPRNKTDSIRIKVANTFSNRFSPKDGSFVLIYNGKSISVKGDTGELKQKQINLVKDFFQNNIPIFERFWNEEIDDDELKRLLAIAAKKQGLKHDKSK